MGLEVFDFIPDLVDTNPVGATDPVSEGDDHLRGIKFTLQNQWPAIGQNAVTRTALQMNDAALLNSGNTFTVNNIFEANVSLDAVVDNTRNINFQRAGFTRWSLRQANDASNQDFQFRRNDAAGVNVDIPYTVSGTTGQVLFLNGTALAPQISFSTTQDMGMFRTSSTQLSFAVGGLEQIRISASSLSMRGGITSIQNVDGAANAPAYTFVSDGTLGMYTDTNNRLSFSVNGALVFHMDAGVAQTSGVFRAPTSADAAAPAFAFAGETTTGMFRAGSGQIGFSVFSTEHWRISGTAMSVLGGAQGIRNVDGTAAIPAYNFVTQTTVGMYRSGSGVLGFASGGVEAATIGAGGLTINAQGGNAVDFSYFTGGVLRWRMRQENDDDVQSTEDWVLRRHNDAGTFLGEPFKIQRLTGLISMLELPSNAGGLSTGMLWRNGTTVMIV